MPYESPFSAEQPLSQEQEPVKQYGTIELSDEEQERLDQASSGSFEPHPTLPNVEVQQMSVEELPTSIQEIIKNLGGKPTSYAAIRTKAGVPLHRHTNDGEVYFSGNGAIVTLLDEHRQEIGRVTLSENAFTATRINQWHSVTNQDEAESLFFGAKFSS